jgi:hypothetical protein
MISPSRRNTYPSLSDGTQNLHTLAEQLQFSKTKIHPMISKTLLTSGRKESAINVKNLG